MSRRLTIPANHVGLIIDGKLNDELLSYAKARRRSLLSSAARAKSEELRQELTIEASILGDLLLALIDGQEA